MKPFIINPIALAALSLAACGGQSGENDKTDRGACETDSTRPLAEVPEADRPDGLSELAAAYTTLGGEWTATLRCLDEPDEAAAFTLTIDEDLIYSTFTGATCDAEDGVSGETGFSLVTESFDGDQSLATRLSVGIAVPIVMSGNTAALAWTSEGLLSSSSIDKYNWGEDASASDATCELQNLLQTTE